MRRIAIVFLSVATLASLGMAAATASTGAQYKVDTIGTESFEANGFIQATLRFNPGTLEQVPTGTDIRWSAKDGTGEPHTVTFVNEDQLPSTVDQVFSCGSDPNDPCSHTFKCLDHHFKCDAHQQGLDGPGDVGLIFPGRTLVWHLTAPAGTDLYYMCAIHPWMQGEIKVVAAGS